MKKTAFLLIMFIISGKAFPQNLDSLFNTFVNSINRTVISQAPNEIQGEHSHDSQNIKCGFVLSSLIRQNLHSFSPGQQKILQPYFTRPASDSSIVSPSGKFRIHFFKSGNLTPNYSGIDFPDGSDHLKIMLDSVAAAFDYSYNYEVNVLGYPPPPSDNGEGGDDLYDIYIDNAEGGYGVTKDEDDLPNDRKTSYIKIHYSFKGFYTEGENAVKVTAAHELHHAIQIGNYIFNPSQFYYYEVTSTSMEEFVYDYVNDYYDYMPNYFRSADRTFSRFSRVYDGYDFAIWNIYLKERFGIDIIKKIWEKMSNGTSALTAISSAIFESGSTFKEEFNFFGQQLVFTNYRSANNTVFDEAANYPSLTLPAPYTESKTINVNSNIAANNYLLFTINKGTYTDSLISIITNSDISNAASFAYSFLTNSESNASKIINNYYYKISSANLGVLKSTNVFNNEPINGDTEKEEIEFAFPQPFIYKKYSPNYDINIPAAPNQTGIAYLNVYSISMDLVYSGELNIISGNKTRVLWNGLDKNNEKLPTGVYIYVTKSGDNIKKGKILIYNE